MLVSTPATCVLLKSCWVHSARGFHCGDSALIFPLLQVLLDGSNPKAPKSTKRRNKKKGKKQKVDVNQDVIDTYTEAYEDLFEDLLEESDGEQ